MEDWGQGCSEVAKGAGVRDALEQETETGTGLLRTGRRTWGLGCSGGGRSPLGAARPFGTPQIGTTLHDVPIPRRGCSGQCPALPRGTARPPPVLSTPPLPEPAWQHLPAGPKRSPRPRAAPFTGPKPGSPLPVNPWWPRARNCGHVLCRVCDLGATAKPRGDTEGARGWVPVPPPLLPGPSPL